MGRISRGRPRAVVCLSGGMDTCVCLAQAARNYDVYAIHFSYGQRTEARERVAAGDVAQLVGVKNLLKLRTEVFFGVSTNPRSPTASIAVPSAAEELAGNRAPLHTSSAVPATYVPFRNANFLSKALSWRRC